MTPATLRDRIRAVLPAHGDVRTGAQQAAKETSNLEENLGFLRTFLLVFAYVALFVGAFIIFNTFSITVAQRTREFGLLRTLGASRRQILRSVVFEGILLGVTASVLGLLARDRARAGARPALQGLRRGPARQRHGARDAHDRRLAAGRDDRDAARRAAPGAARNARAADRGAARGRRDPAARAARARALRGADPARRWWSLRLVVAIVQRRRCRARSRSSSRSAWS